MNRRDFLGKMYCYPIALQSMMGLGRKESGATVSPVRLFDSRLATPIELVLETPLDHLFCFWPPSLLSYEMGGISGAPPYLTSDQSSGWGATHGPPTAICSNGKNLLSVFQVAESPRETGIQLMDLNGKVLKWFSSPFPFDSRLACAMDEKHSYLALQVLWRPPNRLVIEQYDIDGASRGKDLADIPAGDHVATSGRQNGRWQVQVQGMALRDGRLYVPMKLDDKVFQVDSATGKIIQTSSVPAPGGIVNFSGKIYVVSGNRVVSLNEVGSIASTTVSKGLAIDARGQIYVADGGASQQVKVFSQAGKLLRTVGMRGGRPIDGVLDPHSVAVTPDGKTWGTELADDFEVISVWNPDGSRANSFYNMHWSSGQGRLSPDRTELFFGARVQEVEAGLMSDKVDLEHGTWAPYWHLTQTFESMDQRDVLLGYVPNSDHEKVVFRGHEPYLSFEKDMVRADNGKTYLTGGDFSIWLFDPATKKPKLASLLFLHHVAKTENGPYQAYYDQGPSTWLSWADKNGDGKMSLDETVQAINPPLLDHVPKIQNMQLMPDLSVMFLAGIAPQSVNVSRNWFLYRLRPQTVLPSGVPVYDWNKIEVVTELHIPDYSGGDRDPDRAVTRVQLDSMKLANDAVYVRVEPGAKVRRNFSGIDGDGDGWWASRNWRIAPEKFDLKTGNAAWLKLGRRAPAHASPGEMYYPGWGLAGSSHGFDFFADALGQVWAWTDDGLYIGPVYNDNTQTNHYDSNSLFVELTGAYVYDIRDKTYILAGDHGIMVHELKLPALTHIDGGVVTLTADQSGKAIAWDPDGPLPGKKPSYIARSIFDFDKSVLKNTRTIQVDGKLEPTEWSGVAKLPIHEAGKEIGTVQVTFDKTNLYLAYSVRDPNGLKNDGHELPLVPFATGSYVDFDLGPDWSEAGRSQPAEGDVRVVLARIPGASHFQMGFCPIRQDIRRFSPRPATLNPHDIVSPAQQRHFDDISPIP